MTFKEKYTNPKLKEQGKEEVSMDFYAMGEMLEEMIMQVRALRMAWNG